MKRLILLFLCILFIVGFTLLPNNPGTAYPIPSPVPPESVNPEFLSYSCNFPSWVQIGWWQPNSSYPPFSFTNPGSFVVTYGGNHYYYDLTYHGIDEYGWHIWDVTYPRPTSNNYIVNAFVINTRSFSYWVQPQNQGFSCEGGNIYLPLVTK